MPRVPFTDLHQTLTSVLLKFGFTHERASHCALLFAETTRDGVYSHGINRFPRFIAMIVNRSVDPAASPSSIAAFGALERWDGHCGPGNLNAWAAMNRAVELSRLHGIGSVALRNTNHWMRGGTYGWQAADAGSIGICWTNTLANLPAWGAVNPVLGNNPMILAVPRSAGHVVLDIAMSQFSYGALASHRTRGEMLPVAGGFDTEGNLTHDPAAIERSQRPLPIGYWKGSGLSLLLDLIASTTSLGAATHQLPLDSLHESGLSQFFLAIHPAALGPQDQLDAIADGIVESLHQGRPSRSGKPVRYPGEQTLRIRNENLKLGVPVEPETWAQILSM